MLPSGRTRDRLVPSRRQSTGGWLASRPVSDAAYFVAPTSGPGPGVLLLHSWWGLTPEVRRLADRLSDEGYSVLAPDLNAGETFSEEGSAEKHLADADANRLAGLTVKSMQLLSERSASSRIAVVGFSMGASLGLWASVRWPDTICAVSAFYGVQSIDFAGASASYQLHYSGRNTLVDPDEAALMEATIGLEGLPIEVHRYPDTDDWFFEEGRVEHDPEAAGLAWDRLTGFLAEALKN